MTLEIPLLSNIKIEGNSIGLGDYVVSGFTYKYDSCLSVSGSSTITNNIFMDPPISGLSNMITITNCSCIINNNKFVRGDQTIASYILTSGSGDQIITGNIFDRTTIDGTDETLVSGLSGSSIYENNKNQTVYLPVVINQFSPNIDSKTLFQTNSVISDGLTNYYYAVSFVEEVYTVFSVRNASSNIFAYYFNVNNLLPNNVTLKEIKFGLFATSILSPSITTSSFELFCDAHQKNLSNYTVGTNSILDTQTWASRVSDSQSLTYDVKANISLATASTQYVTLALNSNYNTGNNLIIGRILYSCELGGTPATTQLDVQVSPILFKYVI